MYASLSAADSSRLAARSADGPGEVEVRVDGPRPREVRPLQLGRRQATNRLGRPRRVEVVMSVIGARQAVAATLATYIENELPQPQVLLACGLVS